MGEMAVQARSLAQRVAPYPSRPESEAAQRDAEPDQDVEQDMIADEIASARERPDTEMQPADRYVNEIIGLRAPAESATYEPSHDEPPPLEPDNGEPDFGPGDD
uniref:hypothetical protein n=1 Tax=Methylobacterium oryzae TaxID=334852 RepID=UPI00155DDCB1|nr:hypothetical protein [Methylobacterium oryzae]